MNVKEFFGKLFSPYLCFHLLAMAAVVKIGRASCRERV